MGFFQNTGQLTYEGLEDYIKNYNSIHHDASYNPNTATDWWACSWTTMNFGNEEWHIKNKGNLWFLDVKVALNKSKYHFSSNITDLMPTLYAFAVEKRHIILQFEEEFFNNMKGFNIRSYFRVIGRILDGVVENDQDFDALKDKAKIVSVYDQMESDYLKDMKKQQKYAQIARNRRVWR